MKIRSLESLKRNLRRLPLQYTYYQASMQSSYLTSRRVNGALVSGHNKSLGREYAMHMHSFPKDFHAAATRGIQTTISNIIDVSTRRRSLRRHPTIAYFECEALGPPPPPPPPPLPPLPPLLPFPPALFLLRPVQDLNQLPQLGLGGPVLTGFCGGPLMASSGAKSGLLTGIADANVVARTRRQNVTPECMFGGVCVCVCRCELRCR
jgi:hypothetical protein